MKAKSEGIMSRSVFLILALTACFASAFSQSSSLRLVGVLALDVPTGGSDGKALHFVAEGDVADLSVYGVGVANNGGGTDGVEYTFPAQALASGDHLLLARSSSAMGVYFGACIASFDLVLTASSSISQNGNDAIELFENGNVVQTYGTPDEDFAGTPLDYEDAWAFLEEADGEWEVAQVGCSTGATTEASGCPYPFCLDVEGEPGCIDEEACNYDPEATVDDLSCTYPGDACDDGEPLTVFDALDENCDCVGQPFAASNSLVLTGVFHAGAAPKALELYVLDELETLGLYGLGTAQNGGGTDGVEWTFPDEGADAGSFIYVTNDDSAFAFFYGFPPTFTDGGAVCNFNGDDAIELFEAGIGVDVFGEISADGTDTPWEYTDGWAYRVDGTGPDGATFELDHWTFSALGVLDGPVTNAFAVDPAPVGTYTQVAASIDRVGLLPVTAFPNPAQNMVRMVLPEGASIWEVTDMQGRQVIREQAIGPIHILDVSGWSAGGYVIVALSAQGDPVAMTRLQVTH